jgi:DNA mismatch repair protein MutL
MCKRDSAMGATALMGTSLVARAPPPFTAPPFSTNANASVHVGPSRGMGALALAEAVAVYGPLVSSSPALAGAGYAEPLPADSPVGPLALLGQYRESYLLAQSEEGLVLVDQHAAHERVRYERIRARLAGGRVESQNLLLPVRFEVAPAEALLLPRAAELLESAGFAVSELSGRTVLVSAVPADCPAGAVEPFLRDLFATLAESPDGASGTVARDTLAASLACRGAVTIRTRLAPVEAARLLADLARCSDPFTCAHGRPTMLSLAHRELTRRFGRTSG